MSETWIVPAVAGVLGLLLGSFLNVCTLRWPRDESVVSPPSRCGACGERVRWYDNVPVLSWALLRGRCRWCETPISLQYPLVEVVTGLVWAGLFLRYGLSPEALRGSVFLTVLFGIAITDARFYIIPDEFSLGGLVLGLLAAPLPGGLTFGEALLGAVVGFAGLWAMGLLGTLIFKKDAMGGGDVKMMAMVGAFLGWPGVLITLFLGALLGAVVFGPISYRTGKLVPFGIFLSAGAVVAYGWGEALATWYLTDMLGLPPG